MFTTPATLKQVKGILDFFPGTPRDAQAEVLLEIERMWNSTDVFVVTMPTGCHTKGTKVLTYSGDFIPVEEVTTDTILMGPDSTPRKVLNTIHGFGSLYKVTTKRSNTSYYFSEGHILSLVKLVNRSSTDPYSREKVEVKVEDFASLSNWAKHTHYMYAEPIDFPIRAVELDPYILGLWLGDGNTDCVALTTMDSELEESWRKFAISIGCRVTKAEQEGNRASTYYLRGLTNRENPALTLFRNMNLLGNKCIPKEYLHNSKEVRLHVLAGIIDTDGHWAGTKGGWELTFKLRNLIEDVKYLCESLGYACSGICTKLIKGKEYYRIHFSCPSNCELPPVHLSRKVGVKTHRHGNNQRIVVEKVNPGEYFGFNIDKDNLYVMEDFVVTHNSGKTFLSKALMNWALGRHKQFSVYTTPTNILVDQFMEHFPKTHVLRKKDAYKCINSPTGESCEHFHRTEERHCGMCPYIAAVRKAHGTPQVACNVYTLLAHKLKKPVAIYDEAHTLSAVARDRAAKILWHWEYKFPEGICTYGHLLRWVEEHPKRETDKKLKDLYAELKSGAHKFLVEKSLENYRNRKDELCLKLLPVDVSDKCGFLWGKAEKLILMSATIGPMDVKELGLDGKRVAYFDCKSPIPIDRRPLVVCPVGSVGYRNQSSVLPILVAKVKELLKKHPDKGFIHVPYALGETVSELLQTEPRLLFHDRENKTEMYNLFYDSPPEEGRVMVGSGLYEGIDLKEDVARWQIILKVPYDSLAEPAMRWLAEERPKEYAWRTIRQLVQAYGRVSRGPTDFGITYILDSDFEQLYSRNPELFPSFFTEAIQEVKVAPTRRWRV
jgi:hypothetical protein